MEVLQTSGIKHSDGVWLNGYTQIVRIESVRVIKAFTVKRFVASKSLIIDSASAEYYF